MKQTFRYFWRKFLLLFKLADYTTICVESKSSTLDVKPNTIVVIGHSDFPKWILLQCPCGCKETLTLSLMRKHEPYWEMKLDRLHRITLSPSVWKSDGCKSHFFIKKGKVSWCHF